MVKKTLLSLAIAATAAGLAGCNVSSTDKYENDIDNTPVTSGQPGSAVSRVAPVFSPGGGQVPLAIDLLFAAASTSDGTASTTPTNPATVAINKLDGFSNTSAIYLEFNGALNPDTVVAGQSVFLIKLRNGQDNAAIDALDITSILSNSPVVGGAPNPFSPSQPVPNTDYEARYITLNGGATPAIQILPKKPLDPKTKYIVAVTNAIRGADGSVAGPSAEYELVRGTGQLPASTLQPVRTAIQGWEQLAGGFLANATSGAVTQSNVILSYAFTTGGTQDVLKAMAAPGTFLTSQIPTYVHAEGAITQKAVAIGVATALAGLPEDATAEQIEAATAAGTAGGQATAQGQFGLVAKGVGQKLNAANASNPEWTDLPLADGAALRTILIESDALRPFYYAGLITAIADGQGEGLDSEVDKPKSRDYAPIAGAALPYNTLLTAQLTPKVSAAMEAQVRAGLPEGTSEEDAQAAVDAYLDDNLSAAVADQVAALSSGGAIYQGGLQVPNYLPDAAAGVADSALGSWSANDDAAVALGLEQAPRDTNGTTNVTYRFPFAAKQGDAVIPVLATMPAADCDPDGAGPASGKPAAGWPVVIYQHGITVDRTAGLLIGNALASQCIAMVAIDHVMHGVAPLTSSGAANSLRLFNVEQVAAETPAQNSPFAAARAQILALSPDSLLADLKERHNNVGKAVAGGPNVNMVFQGALDGETPVTAASVGKSADLYINLQNFSRVRDGIRQTVLDMMNLGASIGDMDINGDGNAGDLDPSKVYFIGHSLGGIVGTTFLAVNSDEQVRAYNPNLPDIKAAALGNPGGGIIKLLENSPTFSPAILGGLQAAAGLAQGSSSIESFFGVFQAMLDSADPINFAQNLTELPVLVYEDVGGVAAAEGEADDNALPDVVVPNNALEPAVDAAKSYLAGTDPLITQLGITTVLNAESAATATDIGGGKFYFPNITADATVRAAVRMGKGTHSTFSSADPQDVFAETFQQIITFFDPYGATVLSGLPGNQEGFVIQNTDVLEPAAE